MPTTFRPALLLFLIVSLWAAPKQATFVVHGPTIVAFFSPVTPKDLKRDPDTNEALADFRFYATRAREAFARAGIDFMEVYAPSFRVSIEGRTTRFTPGPDKVGYYFIAPGKKPRIEYGVATDDDLRQTAAEYFGTR
jgi:hypothetical protein